MKRSDHRSSHDRATLQHHGVGTALLAAVVAELRARRVRTLQADTAPGNGAMLALVREAEFPLHERYFKGGVHVTLQIDDRSQGIHTGRAG